jgi:hypothetical protein
VSVTQNIPTITLAAGQTAFNTFAHSAQPWSQAEVIIERAGAGNHPWLNTLTPADALTIDIQYSLDNGATWRDIGSATFFGGTVTTKGVTVTENTMSVGIGSPFPTDTAFQVILTATAPTTISGSVVYETL